MNRLQYLKIGTVVLILGIIYSCALPPSTRAVGEASASELPSDLKGDLEEALKSSNTAPEQDTLAKLETVRVAVVTQTGTTFVQPDPKLAPEIAKTPAAQVVHPEQTHSEQVTFVQVTVTVTPTPEEGTRNQSGVNQTSPGAPSSTISPGPSDIPTPTGTSVGGTPLSPVPNTMVPLDMLPDDNSAPSPTSQPTELKQGPTGGQITTVPSPSTINNNTNSPPTFIPEQKSGTQPISVPATTVPESTIGPIVTSSPPEVQPTTLETQPTAEDSGAGKSAVEGVSKTITLLEKILYKLFGQ